MATDASSASLVNGIHTPKKPVELAISLTQSPGLLVHVHLTILEKSIMLFLTSTSTDGSHGSVAMGSLVYALPDRYNPSQPLCTSLYTTSSSLDLATRMAKLLVRKLGKPCYVGSSINLSNAAGGGTVEEEMDAFRAIVDVVTAEAKKIDRQH